MVGHSFLTPDRGVQQTTFANGITVNFTGTAYDLAPNVMAEPMNFHVMGLD
jgi:hypothetical protein